MHRVLLTSGLLAAALASSACDQQRVSDDDPLRSHEIEFKSGDWGGGGENPANGDLQVHIGETTTVPDCQIWDLSDDVVYTPSEANGVEVFRLSDDGFIVSPGGDQCYLDQQWGNYIEVRDGGPNGPVLFSVYEIWAFEGDLGELSGQEIFDALLYTFRWKRIRDGGWWGDILTTSTEVTMFSNMKRKAVLTALNAGYCGSPGLPDEWPPAGDDGQPPNE